MGDDQKSIGAFRTIGELAADIGRPQHILRYWEKRFPQLKPLTRAGNRRYYRPEDVALVKRIDTLLKTEGYTIEGAAKALRQTRKNGVTTTVIETAPVGLTPPAAEGPDIVTLREIRDRLAKAVSKA